MPAPLTDLLIINADDFGLTAGVCEGILRAHHDGVVTSTSILAVAPVFDRGVPSLLDAGLAAGIHLALVGEDPPLLSRQEIPTLVAGDGFRRSWRELFAAVWARQVDPDDVRREVSAQVERVVGAGVSPTHVDSHQHVHLWPAVRDVVIDVAAANGIDAIRVPRARGLAPTATVVQALSRRLARAARANAMRSTERFAGLEHSGHLHEAALIQTVDRLARGTGSAEIGVHPGVAHDPDRRRYAWGFDWPVELAALCSPGVRDRISAAGFRLGTFADIAPAGTS